MIYRGLDIGSRTTALVSLSEQGEMSDWKVVDTGYDPRATIKKLCNSIDLLSVLATGYGRSLAKDLGIGDTVTEIMACAIGVNAIDPECRVAIDIGGQDVKVIAISDSGSVEDFEMNDKCAAGTGKFMEIMANALGCNVDKFGEMVLEEEAGLKINSMCTVFAESEVISLITSGEDRQRIARALHESVVERCAGLAARLRCKGKVMAVGGAARNEALIKLLSEKISAEIFVPDEPQSVVALGAAMEARRRLYH